MKRDFWTEFDFLVDLDRHPGGHCRKPHYWFRKDTRPIYVLVWRAWLRGLCTCPLFDLRITPEGRRLIREKGQP